MSNRLYGTMKEEQIYSNYLKKELPLLIYLPPNYSPLYSYHLLIAQDGKYYFQLGRIARQTEELISNNEIEDVIIIGIPYKNVQERLEMYHPNGKMSDAYIRFLAEELVPYAEEHFQTYSLAAGRTLIGDSLGGTVSLLAALHYPNTFGQIILQSPYINQAVLDQVAAFDNHHLKIYHVVGKEETNVETTNGKRKDFLIPNRELNKMLINLEIIYHYHEFDGDHRWTFWQPDIKQALQYMFTK
ncbi:esterase family protein [Alkalihalobacillus sp. BA299]|uniref:alpha/beta hydrolase n=1 Tax=Alkalihalobacillus sp. BA299 TaxID=2815938 RepID=UPI001AD99159|nr:esterase family protein [Alkalihalobacillus sp. BA299]